MAAHAEELQYGLTRKLIHHLKGSRAVRGTGVVAEVHVVVLWQKLTNAVKDGQSAVARIEHADRACVVWKIHKCTLFFVLGYKTLFVVKLFRSFSKA